MEIDFFTALDAEDQSMGLTLSEGCEGGYIPCFLLTSGGFLAIPGFFGL